MPRQRCWHCQGYSRWAAAQPDRSKGRGAAAWHSPAGGTCAPACSAAASASSTSRAARPAGMAPVGHRGAGAVALGQVSTRLLPLARQSVIDADQEQG